MVNPQPICHNGYDSAHSVSTRAVTGQTGKQRSPESKGSWSPGTRGASQGSMAPWRGRVCTWYTLIWWAIPRSALTKPATGREAHRNQERHTPRPLEVACGRCFSRRAPACPGCRRPPVLTPMHSRSIHPGIHASCRVLQLVVNRGCCSAHS